MSRKLVAASLLLAAGFVVACGEPVAPPTDQVSSNPLQFTADPTTPITDCHTTITTPGDYTLVNDLVSTSADICGITVSGRLGGRVTLRLNGHRIAWNGSPDDIAGFSGLTIGSYVRVLGPGIIEGYWANVLLNGERSEVQGVTTRYPQSWNFLLGDFQVGGRHLKIEGNTLLGGPESGMLVAPGSSDIVVADNQFLGEGRIERSLRLDRATRVEIRNNVFRGAWQAILVEQGSNNSMIGNRIVEFPDYGIAMLSSVGNQVLRNTLKGNGFQVVAWGGSNHVVAGNTITNGGIGIAMDFGPDGPATGSLIERNTVLSNGTDLGEEQGCPSLNTWRFNIFSTASAPCLQ